MDINDIEYSLTLGKVIGKKIQILYFCIIVSLLLPLVSIGICITIALDLMAIDEEMFWLLIVGNILMLVFLGISIYLLVHFKKINRQVKIWLEDCQEIMGYVEKLDSQGQNNGHYQVKITFEIDGKKYEKTSKKVNFLTDDLNYFAKYNLKCIKILYSKDYDQVLIPKQKVL